MNRKIFAFNEGLDKWVIAPVATGWDWVMPDPVEACLWRFFNNLNYPVDLGNNLLQGKLEASGIATARFVVNTTLGLAGLFDVATGWGMERQLEDFGQTLAVWGVKPGPYLVLPVFGPSSPRDAVGLVPDQYMSLLPFYLDTKTLLVVRGVYLLNVRSIHLDDVKNAREAAFDYYVFVRNAYKQHRKRQLLGEHVSDDWESDAVIDDNLYLDPEEYDEN